MIFYIPEILVFNINDLPKSIPAPNNIWVICNDTNEIIVKRGMYESPMMVWYIGTAPLIKLKTLTYNIFSNTHTNAGAASQGRTSVIW